MQRGIMDLPATIQLYTDSYMANTYKVQPATVIEHHGATVDIELSINPDGVILRDIPVLYLAGGGTALTFDLIKGDQGVALFSDVSLDAYERKQGKTSDDDERRNAMADALFLPALGFKGVLSEDKGIVRKQDLQSAIDSIQKVLDGIIDWIDSVNVNGQGSSNVPYTGTKKADNATSSANMRAE